MSPLLSTLLLLTTFTPTAYSFICKSTGVSCNGLLGYTPANATTLAAVKSLFAIKNLRSLLGANNLPLNTSGDFVVDAKQMVKVPFPCVCGNGTGRPIVPPTYTVVKGDGLYHIASEVYGGVVTYQEIQAFNGIKDRNLIDVGQKLKIPLPCSCDEVDGEKVVHYGHVLTAHSTVEGIAQEFEVSVDTILRANGFASEKDLKADVAIDIPLRACTSTVGNNSLDYPFLVSNGTYAFTAANCVLCKCDAAYNWNLQCESSNIKSALWETCPAISCGVSQLTSLGCNSICAYAGYTKNTILSTSLQDSTCSETDNNNGASKLGLRRWSTCFALIFIHFVLYFYLLK